ncbi:PepSY domain-containing protein [Marinithermofilum abyssi]|uniref:PepSY domain-containing protein n=1 Tax=Marinithermofilum abyssi TaxID=1571185 RepID=UPI001E564BE6|nr:PepSY domain-containing protein [Marinithermofilum abyssi]
MKFFALISVFSLALGASAAIVYSGYKYVTEEKKEPSAPQVSKPNPKPKENNQETEEPTENTKPSTEPTQTPNTQPQKLSAEDAVRIAREKAGGGYLEEVEYKEEKGLEFYKVELTSGKKEYTLKISAYSKEIIKAEVD